MKVTCFAVSRPSHNSCINSELGPSYEVLLLVTLIICTTCSIGQPSLGRSSPFLSTLCLGEIDQTRKFLVRDQALLTCVLGRGVFNTPFVTHFHRLPQGTSKKTHGGCEPTTRKFWPVATSARLWRICHVRQLLGNWSALNPVTWITIKWVVMYFVMKLSSITTVRGASEVPAVV